MFVALEMSVAVVERLVPVETKIKRCSAQLASQIQRASESVALNLAERRWRSAGDQRRHYEMAAGSASELTVALRIALAKRYVTKADLAEVDKPLDQVRAMLFRLTHR
jgi:four helix bundle protein